MRRAERLFRLVALMRAADVSRADDLAHALEVSVRTIYRDIAHLQASGLPIEGEAGIGYILRPGFDLPAMTFSHEQMDALALGLAFIMEAGDRELVQATKEVRSKIAASLPQGRFAALEDASMFAARRGLRAPSFAPLVRQAIRERLVASLCYQNAGGKTSQRDVEPLSLTVFTDGWMMAAWCRLRCDFRYFRLERVEDFRLSTEVFEDNPATSLVAFRTKVAHKAAPF